MSHLPELEWVPTRACSSRFGLTIGKVWLHRWGVRYTTEAGEALSYKGVIREFQNPANEASSHFVFPGSAVPNHCTQMVARKDKSWTEALYNRTGISIESADAIWLGHDPDGFVQLARITAFLLHENGLPPNWVHGFTFARKGFLRHADGGALAGGHTQCPTTDMQLWGQFVQRVQAEHHRGGFRKVWDR
jgi:hypothetical protein